MHSSILHREPHLERPIPPASSVSAFAQTVASPLCECGPKACWRRPANLLSLTPDRLRGRNNLARHYAQQLTHPPKVSILRIAMRQEIIPFPLRQNEFQSPARRSAGFLPAKAPLQVRPREWHGQFERITPGRAGAMRIDRAIHARSEEHTSELQSQSNLVCRLLLEKKK